MESFLQFIQQVFSSEIGSLTHHLITVFSIAGTLQITLGFKRQNFPDGKKLIFGLCVLLFLQLGLFFLVALAWQGVINSGKWFPFLERSVSILSVLVIVWLWVFPSSVRKNTYAILLISLLVLTLFLLLGILWSGQPAFQPFNGSLVDKCFVLATCVILGLGIIMLAMKRPASWGLGLGMMLILLIGSLYQLLFSQQSGDYSTVMRLTEIAAYPLLFGLTHRIISQTSSSDLLLDILGSIQVDSACKKITKYISRELQADLCMLVSLPEQEKSIQIRSIFDKNNPYPTNPGLIEQQNIPVLVAALQQGLTLRLPVSSQVTDLVYLSQILGLQSLGDLMMVSFPLSPPSKILSLGFILLTPYSRRSWTQDHIQQVIMVATPLAHFLHQMDKMGANQFTIDHIRDELVETQSCLEKLEKLVAELKVENDYLHQVIQNQATPDGVNTSANLQQDYQDSMRELSVIRETLTEEDQKLTLLQSQMEKSVINVEYSQRVLGFIQEIRTAITSVFESSSLLLGETIGRLDNLQQRLLERIRVTSERMNRLIDDFICLLQSEQVKQNLSFQEIQVGEVVEDILTKLSPQLDKKQIILHKGTYGLPVVMIVDIHVFTMAVQLVFKHAIENVPAGGNIHFSMNIQEKDGNQDYLLLQIVEEGQGIPPEDLPSIFSPGEEYRSSKSGSTMDIASNLFQVKTLVEALEGRILVDNNPGKDVTFVLLLPLMPQFDKVSSS
jgi:signal transduction histidine kinase